MRKKRITKAYIIERLSNFDYNGHRGDDGTGIYIQYIDVIKEAIADNYKRMKWKELKAEWNKAIDEVKENNPDILEEEDRKVM